MTQQQERNYMSPEGFSKLLRSLNGDATQVDTKNLAILCPMHAEIKALGGPDSRLIEFVITSDRVDREQDILSVDGWETDNYEKNPVVLWAHDHYCPPIGNSRSVSRSGNLIKSICEFTPQDLNPFGYMIYRMYVEKFMHATSVGFQPIEYTYAADRKYGINYIKQDLLEYSCVPVPANPDAIAVARSKGIDTAPLKAWAEKVLDESRSGSTSLSDDARRRLEILRAVSSPSGRALILELGEMKMAGTTETPPVTAPSTASTIKKIERWECGTTGHIHDTEVEAKSCADFDETVDKFIEQGLAIAEFVKHGRKLNEGQAGKLKEALDIIAPAPAPVEDEATTDESGVEIVEGEASEDEEKGFTFELSEETLRAAVTSAVDERLREVTGRVD